VTFRVRPARPGDADRLVELAREVGSERQGWLITTGEWRSPSDERRYLKAIRRHPDAAVFVAEDNGDVVGRLSLSRDAHPASGHVADLGLMVSRGHRRQGIGLALMHAAEEWARRAGVRKLELHVFHHNVAAIGLYEKLGYEREGLRRGHYRRGDELIDAILMAKEVR
jgi:RimJ/RimL family protein N-acetyltransferase